MEKITDSSLIHQQFPHSRTIEKQIVNRVAKFDPKVGSRRRTTKIKHLVVLIIILVVLILLPYSMYVVLVLILLFFIAKRKIT